MRGRARSELHPPKQGAIFKVTGYTCPYRAVRPLKMRLSASWFRKSFDTRWYQSGKRFLLFVKSSWAPNTEHETFPDVLTQQTFPFAYTNTSHTAQALWLVSVLPLAPIFHHEMGMSGGAVPKKSRLRRTEGDCRAVLKNFGACGGRFQGR